MQNLNIEAQSETPEINLNAETGLLEFKGRSLPEDVNSFYQQVINWVEEYLKNPASATKAVFKLEYFNTASSKAIYEILVMLDKLASGNDVSVSWYYETDDEDMLDIGKEFKENLQLDFNIISIDAIL